MLVSPKMVISFVCLVPVRLLLPSLAAKGLSTAHTSYEGGVLLSLYYNVHSVLFFSVSLSNSTAKS